MNKRSPAHLNGRAQPGSPEATPAPAAQEAGLPGAALSEAGQLPPEKRPLVEELLVEGATFEDVVEAANEGEGPKVTQGVVAHFFRTNLEIQKRRVQRLVEKAEALKASLHADPNSAEGKLAEAALLTGLLRLSRDGAELSLKDAVSLRMQRDNLRLRRRILHMKERDAIQKHRFNEARMRHEFEKFRLTKEKARQAREHLRSLKQGQQLGPETFRKIQEIYGLLNEPFIPPELQAENSEPPAA
jgi:hypothetical protein